MGNSLSMRFFVGAVRGKKMAGPPMGVGNGGPATICAWVSGILPIGAADGGGNKAAL